MRRLVIMVLRTLILAYLAVCAVMYFFQHKLIYIPDRHLSRTPGQLGMPAADLELTTDDDVLISAWYCEPEDPRGALILCHGNAGDMADRLDLAKVFYDSGLAVLLFDYRGYGRSGGSPDEAGTYQDAEAAWRYLTEMKGLPAEKVIIYGESIGAAVAIELASRHSPAALIAEGAFTALYDVAADIYPYLPVKLLARVRYESIDKVGGIDCPKLFIHSPADDLVPYEQGRALFEAARPPKQFLATRGGHNDGGFLVDREYVAAVRHFVDQVLEPTSARRPTPP